MLILNIILSVILVLLNVFDVHTTCLILGAGGRELNPLLRWVIKKTGVLPGLIASKTVCVVPYVFCAIASPNWLTTGLLIVLIGWYAWVIRGNHNVIMRINF